MGLSLGNTLGAIGSLQRVVPQYTNYQGWFLAAKIRMFFPTLLCHSYNDLNQSIVQTYLYKRDNVWSKDIQHGAWKAAGE